MWKIVIEFSDGSKREHSADSKGQAKRKLSQVLSNIVVQRLGAFVRVFNPSGIEVSL